MKYKKDFEGVNSATSFEMHYSHPKKWRFKELLEFKNPSNLRVWGSVENTLKTSGFSAKFLSYKSINKIKNNII